MMDKALDTTLTIEKKKEIASSWFRNLRDQITSEFEKIETELTGQLSDKPAGKFELKKWDREKGGGGEIGLMKGRVFEKVGVNISTVHGEFSEQFRKEIPGAEEDPNFWASGISLVAHMQNPHVPAVHLNTRFIVTTKEWFGGGTDLTPMIPNDEDTDFFHANLKKTCDKYDEKFYPDFKAYCDRYFYLKHRKEPRGIGGIFYDYHNTNNWDNDFNFTQDVGKTFLDTYQALVRKHMNKPWNDEERYNQLVKRGRYVEFNLLYDRGTKFGLMTDGNVDGILMSMPPKVLWP